MPDNILINLQRSLKSVVEQADAIENKINSENRAPTTEEMTQLSGHAEKATQLTKQIGEAQALKAARAFGEQSEGAQSQSAATFSGDTFGVSARKNGEIEGIGADARTGEIYSLSGASKSAVEMLKSGEYKDAFNDRLRSRALGLPMKAASMKVLAEVGFGSGEAWLPPDYRAELVKKIATSTSMRQNARVYTTGTDIITFPSVNYATDDKYTSGVRFSWRGSAVQTAAISEATNPVAGQVKIPVNLATAAIILQREQFEDNAFDLLGYVTELGGEAYSLGEEDSFTNGDGAGQPLGFLQHPSVTIAAGSSSTLSGVTYQGTMVETTATAAIDWGTVSAGIIGTEAVLPPQYEMGAKWYANKKTYAAIRAINAGTATLPQWSLGDSYPNYANGMKASLLGYGTEKNQFMPDIAASAGTVLTLGDMTGYYIIDRVGLTVEVDPSVYRLRDQVVVYMRKRVGGQLVHYWKLRNCSIKA